MSPPVKTLNPTSSSSSSSSHFHPKTQSKPKTLKTTAEKRGSEGEGYHSNRIYLPFPHQFDHTSLLSPTKNPSSPISSFLGSPRFFNGFLAKTLSDAETSVMSPTSILDTKNSSSFMNPFAYESLLSEPPTPSPETNNSTNKPEPQAMGLALIDSIIQGNEDGNDRNLSKAIDRMVLFGSKLNVQIPAINPQSSLSPAESLKSPADFGIKTRSSQPLSPLTGSSPAKDFSGQLSLKEMELSEECTCMIAHGPNPRTTQIFDVCIVESCCGYDAKDSEHNKNREFTSFETDV